MRYLEATLLDGSTVVGEFSALSRVGNYVGQVFRGEKPFNAWKLVGDTLPSGEPNKIRTRQMFSGAQIRSIQEVDSDFAPIQEISRGPRGRFTVPEDFGAGHVTEGQVFPKHRDGRSLREYVILAAATAEGGLETRLYLDNQEVASFDPNAVPALPDADDDGDERIREGADHYDDDHEE